MLLPGILGLLFLAPPAPADPEKGARVAPDGNARLDDAPAAASAHPPRPRRSATLVSVSTMTSVASTARVGPPPWLVRLKDAVHPRTAPADLDAAVPTYRLTPIVSGIVIPFSILLEIPGLTEHWYIRTADNKTVEIRRNPAVLDVALALSMACAVAANVCLVSRFLEVRVKLMTIMCVVFLTLHDVINTVAVTTFAIEHRFDDGFTFGQSFWMTLFSTVASSITNLTLVVDLIRTPDFALSGSGLTRKQRSLVIIVILLLCYIAFGALVNALILHLSFIDAMYFSVVCIETIGFGDFTPTTTGARLFACVYAAAGIVNLALAVGMIRGTVVESLEVGYRRRLRGVRAHRREAHRRRRVAARWRDAVEWRLRAGGHAVWVRDAPAPRGRLQRVADRVLAWPSGGRHFQDGRGGLGVGRHPHGMHLNIEALGDAALEGAALETGESLAALLPPGFRERRAAARGVPPGSPDTAAAAAAGGGEGGMELTHGRLGRMAAMLGRFALAVHASAGAGADADGEGGGRRGGARLVHAASTTSAHAEHAQLPEEHDHLGLGMQDQERKAFYARLTVAWSLFLLFWAVGSAIFMETEGWSYGTALYFCFITFTTIGFGDLSPKTPAGRSIFVVWALLGVGAMTILISVIAEAFSDRYQGALHRGAWEKALKRYKARALGLAGAPPPVRPPPLVPPTPPNMDSGAPEAPHVAAAHAHAHAARELEALPHAVLAHARVFHEHVHYFLAPDADEPARDVPAGVAQLMDHIAGEEALAPGTKREILADAGARHTLFALSLEKAFREMVEAAEMAIAALERRQEIDVLVRVRQGGDEIDVACGETVQVREPPEPQGSTADTPPDPDPDPGPPGGLRLGAPRWPGGSASASTSMLSFA